MTLFHLDFDFSSGFNLSRSEYIFYFHRLRKRGIYYILFNDFVSIMNETFSIMPLVRPTRSAQLQVQLKKHEELNVSKLHAISQQLLHSKGDSFGENDEAMARDGKCRDSSLKAPSAGLMSQPLLQLLKSNAGPNVTGNKRSRNDGGIDWMTKQELIDLATVEKVTFTKSWNKTKIIEAITAARKSDIVLLK